MSIWARDWWKPAVVAFAVTVALYWPSVKFEFVDFDDNEYVIDNAHVREGLTGENVRWALCSMGYADNWHPLAWTSLMADVTVGRMLGYVPKEIPEGEWAFGSETMRRLSRVVHLHNVLLHGANAALLVVLIGLMVGRAGSSGGTHVPLGCVALTLALLWALHPLRVEVVCWAAERKELLSVFFMLLTLLFYRRNSCLLSLLAYVLALMAKPVAVTLPAVIFAWDWIFGGKVRWGRFAAFSALSLVTCCLTMASQTSAMVSGGRMDAFVRLYGAMSAPLVYLRQTFWPTGLSCVYEVASRVDVITSLGGAALILAMAVCSALWLWKRGCGLGIAAFAVAWVYVGLVPMLGFVKVGCQGHNDRYTYWIGCGVCVVLALALEACLPKVRAWMEKSEGERFAEEWRTLSRVAACVAVVALLALGWASRSRMGVWRDTVTLFRDAVSKSYSTELAVTLAKHLTKDGGAAAVEESEGWFRLCVSKHPSVDGLVNLAELLLCKPDGGVTDAFGGVAYAEAGMLIDSALATEPENEKAKKLLERLMTLRGTHGKEGR